MYVPVSGHPLNNLKNRAQLLLHITSEHFTYGPHHLRGDDNLNHFVLVTDNTIEIPDSVSVQMHKQLILIRSTYAHSVDTGEVLPIAESPAQTKPKLISRHVIGER